MAILNLTTDQKSVCAIPPPGVEGKPEWSSSDGALFSIEDIAENGLSATVVAGSRGGGVGLLTVEVGDDQLVISTLEVRVTDEKVKFTEVSASAPDQKEQKEAKGKREPKE